MFALTTKAEVEELVWGATVMGTGGGGSPRYGLRLLEEALSLRGEIKVVDINELSENSIVVSPYYVGTIAPSAERRKPVKIGDPIRTAFEELERVLGKRVSAVVACELGGSNTAVALYIAAKLNLPVVDGDLLGRAAPEIHQCTANIFGYPMYPAVIVTESGNIVVVKQYSDINDYEALARYISVIAGCSAAVVDTPLSAENARKAVVKKTISLCLSIGKALREAWSTGKDPVEEVRRILGGWKIFEGEVTKYNWRDEGGFLRGEAYLKGTGEWRGHSFRTWIKNEHIMAWRDNKPIVMPPDLIIFFSDKGKPVTNAELGEGMKISVITAKAPEIWRTPRGLELFGPRHFGLDYDYIPVEELVKES